MPMKVRYETVYGEVIAEDRGGVRKQYIPDPLGSTVALMDDTQTITDTFSYWPYGEVASRTGTTATSLQYVGTLGYYNDSVIRSYVRARYLDARSGRWFTEDPLGYTSREFDLFRYAASSPATLSDRYGLDPMQDMLKCIQSCAKDKGDEKKFSRCVGSCTTDAIIDKYCWLIWCNFDPNNCQHSKNPCKPAEPNTADCMHCCDAKYDCCLAKSRNMKDPPKCSLKHRDCTLGCTSMSC